MKSLKERQYELNLQLEEYTRADENYYTTVSNVFNLAKNALGLFRSSEVPEKRALLNFLLQNSLVEDKKLTFELRKPFDLLLKVPLQELENRAVNPVHPVWLPLLDEFRTQNWRQIKEEVSHFISTCRYSLQEAH